MSSWSAPVGDAPLAGSTPITVNGVADPHELAVRAGVLAR
jgi:hypothetical protein